MSYFTIFHIIALVVIVILFILFLIISLKEKKTSVVVSMVFLNVFVMGCLSIFMMLIIDQYTKKAKVLDLSHERILINETIVFSGKVQNIGGFDITSCTLEIKLVNAPMEKGKLDGSIFKQERGFFDVFKSSKPVERSTVEMEFKIAQDLKAGETRPFSVYMPYPASFRAPSFYHKIYCH
ncbi:putative DUF2393 domain protein [Campylobacter iguaniorum]|uniref:DUF2393 family protein n=1 Tax=Campylobacter iguaniorum TaxID=1244531 RepID=UPI0007C8E928|nr:DUF2393 family protein [Campylobacter iguaniorum]ANE35348.1 putative DUF2393 domain protein [Campylobacter iguaniorum]